MSTAAIGARVLYGGHDATFMADIFQVGNVNVVRASMAPIEAHLERPADRPTHTITDFPVRGFWRPDLGVLVVPEGQVQKIAP